MPLSCNCDYDVGYCDWFHYGPGDYSILATKRRRRCTSCKALISIGATVSEIVRFRPPCNVEERICGDDYDAVPLAPHYLCESCADLYFSLDDLGFCAVSPYDDMRELVNEYHETYQKAD